MLKLEKVDDHQRSPFRVYAYYRWVLSVLLLSIFVFQHPWDELIGNHHFFYLSVILAFCTFTSLTLVVIYYGISLSNRTIFTLINSDLIFMIVLAYASGGLNQHLSVLMVVTVAAGSILFVGAQGTFFAAMATVLVLAEQFFLEFKDQQNFPQLGLLGILFFAIAWLSQNIARRLQEAETKVTEATAHVADLKNINQMIIQRMQTGIMVIDSSKNVSLMNAAAANLLGIEWPVTLSSLKEISPILFGQLVAWLQEEVLPISFQNKATSLEVKVSFARFNTQEENILIFLDDQSRLIQQAQLLKLKSLARLTAGIAHEIRNPLGAISHAAQLLAESPLSDTDHRLANIMQQQTKRVNMIIENVLQLSRRQPPHLELILLKPWFEKFMQEIKGTCNFVLNEAVDPLLWKVPFDPSHLTQVLTNLCENGLRYSERQTGIASLTVKGGVTQEGFPFLEIQDQGSGLSPEQKEHLFEPFYTSESQGTGLGLFLAKELCELNKSVLAYVPSELPGCCFRITFSHPRRALV